MLRTVLIIIVFFSATLMGFSADVSLQSGIDITGRFNNRLRFDSEVIGLSLLASVSTNGLEWIEPDVFIKKLSVGRIVLKGSVRELTNPDGNCASASVLTEKSGLRVTDSISRSSRYGISVVPFKNHDCSAWAYKANSGVVSAGIASGQLQLFSGNGIRVEAESLAVYGSQPGVSDNKWFGYSPLLPAQSGLNIFSDVRIAAGESGEGRRMLVPAENGFFTGLSIASAASVPEYTEAGGMLRVYSSAGWREFYLCGMVQLISEDYIAGSGLPPLYGYIAGLAACGSINSGILEISGSAEYCIKRKNPGVIPSRFIEQKSFIKSSLELGCGQYLLKVTGDYSYGNECSGLAEGKFDINTGVRIDAGILRFDAGCGSGFEDESYEWRLPDADIGVLIRTEVFKTGVRIGYKKNAAFIKSEAGISSGTYEIAGNFVFSESGITGFSIGFEI